MAREDEEDAAERAALGAHLKKVRVAAGYTLRSAADALTERGSKIGYGAIGAWEDGRNVPSALWMGRLARLYGVPVDAFYSEETVNLEVVRLASQLRTVILQEDALKKESIGGIRKTARRKQTGSG